MTLFIGLVCEAFPITFVHGHFYTSDSSNRVISHFDQNGTFVDSYLLNSSYGSAIRGLAFGNNGRLYATTVNGSNFGVVAIDEFGEVRETYFGTGFAAGGASYGKISFSQSGHFFVSVQNNLIKFAVGNSSGSTIFSSISMEDSEVLPNGNLLALSQNSIDEISPSGQLVRHIGTSILLGDARGIEYDQLNNDIFVSMLGYSGEQFRILKIDGATGFVEDRVSFHYADDLYLTHGRRLLVGSRTLVPGIFSTDLTQLGSIGNERQYFVTQMAVPEPSAFLACVGGILNILARRVKIQRETS